MALSYIVNCLLAWVTYLLGKLLSNFHMDRDAVWGWFLRAKDDGSGGKKKPILLINMKVGRKEERMQGSESRKNCFSFFFSFR